MGPDGNNRSTGSSRPVPGSTGRPAVNRPERARRAGTPARARPHRTWRPRILRGLLLFVALACMMSNAMVQADSYDDRRVRAGARLFRALLAADTALETKTAPDGALHVVMLGSDPRLAGDLAVLVVPPEEGDKARIRGLTVRVDIRDALPAEGSPLPVGIFLATPQSPRELERLVRWGIAHHVILYSPFEGDVEHGATAGISIEATVQPYLNAGTLEASGIDLKPFFLKVAKVHR